MFESTPRDQARTRIDAAIFHAAIDEFAAAVTDEELFTGSSSTPRVVDPEAAIRAGRLVRSLAPNSVYHYIVRARQLGLSWTSIAAALGIRDMDSQRGRWDITRAVGPSTRKVQTLYRRLSVLCTKIGTMAPSLRKVAEGIHVGALFPRSIFNTVVLEGPGGDVVVDAGFPWSRKRLAHFVKGRSISEHVVTHAHGDHVGSTAWLCAHTGAPLAMSDIEADDFENGDIAWHAGAGGKYWVAPLGHTRRHVDRRLKEGDFVAGFEVVAQPGHSPGLLAFWREADRTLVVGDGPINLSTDPTHPRWLHLPVKLHHKPEQAVMSRKRLVELEPQLIISTHGYPVRGLDRWRQGVHKVAH